MCCFLVFQLTALVVRGPADLHSVFTVSPDWIAIDHEEVKGTLACVQDSVRGLFTHRNFYPEIAISVLNTAVTAADAVRHTFEFDTWGAFIVEAGIVIADLKSCREKVVS